MADKDISALRKLGHRLAYGPQLSFVGSTLLLVALPYPLLLHLPSTISPDQPELGERA